MHRLRAGITLSSNKCTLDLDCFVDSDWACFQRTRKSTSGVVVKLLNCPVDFCARTQGTIALSSGEAELYAIGQGISETLYVRNLILDAELAKKVKLHIYTDSTAGKSMATRFGSGKKTKHVELRFLYMQDLVARGDLQIRKVHTTENCADPFTKHLDIETLKSHLGRLCVETVFRCFSL